MKWANRSDLDSWLKQAEVDTDLETAVITYVVASLKSPALLFENFKGHPGHRTLYNVVGRNLTRLCLIIGEDPAGPCPCAKFLGL